ncbi:MAG: hypothetical protein HKN14_11120 [Marinicaulis sp.]|nr:hypothetical protein [Marinicaulis sp.]
MTKLRIIAVTFIAIGLVVPRVIDAYEVANSLDISRNVGSLPWLTLLITGVFILTYSFIRQRKD